MSFRERTSKQKLKRMESSSGEVIRRKNLPGHRKSKCKGLEAGPCLVCEKKTKRPECCNRASKGSGRPWKQRQGTHVLQAASERVYLGFMGHNKNFARSSFHKFCESDDILTKVRT